MADPALHLPRAALTDDERDAFDHLARLHGPGELRATVLALLLTPESQRERRAWQAETRGLSTARDWHATVMQLSRASRLPWLERLLGRLAKAPLGDRQALVEAARRVMAADGQIRPIDRLHWLVLRHRLGDPVRAVAQPAAHNEMAELSLHTLREVARVTAFLSRLVPTGEAVAGQGWYLAVMSPWLTSHDLPACQPPDADGFFNALAEVQAMPWMLRPVLVRGWLEQALALSPSRRLVPDAADALRLAGQLLDCPMPPELARHYAEPDAD
ncbi:hypothetical protein [Rhizobacter sp. Root1221]|uniref:hypothetical protein n=1 Tax=Rhizobacter sp. Root1221 TaxID=1736433 RepID=UPI0007013276|nr:hypothetical protein [Rhizobacter sp. Root1221]KQV99782.1 hypothetical protein ASC87_03620 [Rhizobacter sp. Root1221]